MDNGLNRSLMSFILCAAKVEQSLEIVYLIKATGNNCRCAVSQCYSTSTY